MDVEGLTRDQVKSHLQVLSFFFPFPAKFLVTQILRFYGLLIKGNTPHRSTKWLKLSITHLKVSNGACKLEPYFHLFEYTLHCFPSLLALPIGFLYMVQNPFLFKENTFLVFKPLSSSNC
jgi:hypothetical protein